jgi:hypothetical protein
VIGKLYKRIPFIDFKPSFLHSTSIIFFEQSVDKNFSGSLRIDLSIFLVLTGFGDCVRNREYIVLPTSFQGLSRADHSDCQVSHYHGT